MICLIEQVGFQVCATVCYLGGANLGLLKVLEVTPNQPNFNNPFDQSRKVHVFTDVPHLLKLIRNNLVDHGIETHYGYVSAAPLHLATTYQDGRDFKLNHKVSLSNLKVKGADRQKVRTAAHLLSKTTAKAVEYLRSNGKTWNN